MLKKDLEEKVSRLIAEASDARQAKRRCEDQFKSADSERNELKLTLDSSMRAAKDMIVAIETAAAIKFPEYYLAGDRDKYAIKPDESTEYPEGFLVLRHLYNLAMAVTAGKVVVAKPLRHF